MADNLIELKKMKGEKPPAVPLWTNMENKKLSAQTTAPEKETARNNIRRHFSSLSDREIEAINLFPEMLDTKILDIMHDGKFTGDDMYDLLRPYISGPNIMSKICIDSGVRLQDRRHVNLKIMAAMRRVFGISIDKILDECFQSLEPRNPPQK